MRFIAQHEKKYALRQISSDRDRDNHPSLTALTLPLHIMKYLSRIKSYFEYLTRDEINVEVLKVVSLFVCIICALAAILTPLTLNSTYIARINCARLDVQNGIYLYLTQQIAAQSANTTGSDTRANAFTKSQVALLSNYARDHALKSPQYIIHNLYDWCSVDYNTTEIAEPNGENKVSLVGLTTTCLSKKWPRRFKFQEELIGVGLEVIVGYAFYDANQVEEPDADVGSLVAIVVPALLASIVLQIGGLAMTFFVYTRADPAKEHANAFKAHVLAYISMAACVSSFMALISITVVCSRIRKNIYAHLNNYGMSLMFGTTWFLLLWVSSMGALVSAVVHMIPIVCGETWFQYDEGDDDDEDEMMVYSPTPGEDLVPSTGDKYATNLLESPKRERTLRDHKFRGIFQAQRAALDYPQNENEAEELVNLGLSLYTMPFTRTQSLKYSELRHLDAQAMLYNHHVEQYPTYPAGPFQNASSSKKDSRHGDGDLNSLAVHPCNRSEKDLTGHRSRATSVASATHPSPLT